VDSVTLLKDIVSEYPRIWEFYKINDGERVKTMKHQQRYPLPIDTLSMVLDFHKWTHYTASLFSDVTGLELPNHIKKTAVGPDPVVIYKLTWIGDYWSNLENSNKHLAKTLTTEIINWQTQIKRRVNDGDIYVYLPTEVCQACFHHSVMRINDVFICVNTACRDLMTGEVRRWK